MGDQWDAPYGNGLQATATPGFLLPNYGKRLEVALQQAEQRLADLKRTQEIFTQHPEFEELLTLLQRNGV